MGSLSEKQVADAYDEIAEHIYEGPAMYRDTLALVPDCYGRILDVGCGQGRFLELLKRRYPKITELAGCDISPRLCAMARDRVSGAEISVCNAERLDPYPDSRFDFVFMVGSLEHMQDHLAALTAACRVLRQNGKLIVSVPNREWIRYERWASRHKQGQPVDDYWFRPAELSSLCVRAGFMVEEMRGVWALLRGNWIHVIENWAATLFPRLHYKMKCIGIRCRKL